jgi:hypothetical protein
MAAEERKDTPIPQLAIRVDSNPLRHVGMEALNPASDALLSASAMAIDAQAADGIIACTGQHSHHHAQNVVTQDGVRMTTAGVLQIAGIGAHRLVYDIYIYGHKSIPP